MRHGSTPSTDRTRSRHIAPACWLLGVPLLALLAPTAASGQVSDARLGMRTAPILLLTRPDVQADLALTPEQTAGVSQAIRSLYAQAEALRGKPNTPEVVAARRAIDQTQSEWIQTRLSVEQQSRLQQIDLQWEGPTALLTRPMVAEALELDPNQRRALADAVVEHRRLAAQGDPAPASVRQLAESTLSILSEEQEQRWKAMLGHPFALQREGTHDPSVKTAGGSR